jgi:hypothetical protein
MTTPITIPANAASIRPPSSFLVLSPVQSSPHNTQSQSQQLAIHNLLLEAKTPVSSPIEGVPAWRDGQAMKLRRSSSSGSEGEDGKKELRFLKLGSGLGDWSEVFGKE